MDSSLAATRLLFITVIEKSILSTSETMSALSTMATRRAARCVDVCRLCRKGIRGFVLDHGGFNAQPK